MMLNLATYALLASTLAPHVSGSAVHPIVSMDDPRLLNPWSGVPGAVEPSKSIEEKEQRNLRNGKKPDNTPGPPGGGGGGGGGGSGGGGPSTTPPPPPADTWHAIIVGAGPGGCSAARTLVEEGVDASKILIIERGPSLEDFKDKPNYTNALYYGATQADPDFREDIPNTPIVLGNGVGGGTNHFGMQFIDQSDISDASSRQAVIGSDISSDVNTFASFAGATSYADADYDTVSVKDNFDNLYAKINDVLGVDGKSYRNKVYKTGNDLADQPRLNVGDLIPTGVLLLYTF